MIHGAGRQQWMRKKVEEMRNVALMDRNLVDPELWDDLEISGSQGGGRYNPKTYQVWQYPFPLDVSVRERQMLDIRKVRPEVDD